MNLYSTNQSLKTLRAGAVIKEEGREGKEKKETNKRENEERKKEKKR